MDNMRYDHAMMSDHVAAQANLVGHMNDLRTQALNVVQHVSGIWTAHGSNAAQQCYHEIDQAFQAVFATIERHGAAVGHASVNAGITDGGVAAKFRGL